MHQTLIRFIIGSAIVSAFAIIGDVLKPKSFAGLFGAAPSVALATLAMTIVSDGPAFAAIEARSMMAGAVAFFIYASLVSRIMMRYKFRAILVTLCIISTWLGVAGGVYYFVWGETRAGQQRISRTQRRGRGKSAASIDAAGSSMGSIGLFVFAFVVRQFLSRDRAWIVLGGATVLWLAVSVAVWQKGALDGEYCSADLQVLIRYRVVTKSQENGNCRLPPRGCQPSLVVVKHDSTR